MTESGDAECISSVLVKDALYFRKAEENRLYWRFLSSFATLKTGWCSMVQSGIISQLLNFKAGFSDICLWQI